MVSLEAARWTRLVRHGGVAALVVVVGCNDVGATGRRDEMPVIPMNGSVMVPLGASVFAEPGLTTDSHRELLSAHAAATAEVRRFFGAPRNGWPLTLFCRSAVCKLALGAPAVAAAANDLGFARDGVQTQSGFLVTPVVVVTGPGSKTARILTHELVHAEMKSWAPYDAIPTWFSEGLATWISREPDCRSSPQVSSFDIRQLDTKARWEAHLRTSGDILGTYCLAEAEAGLWARRLSAPESIGAATRRLLQAVAGGAPFEVAAAVERAPE